MWETKQQSTGPVCPSCPRFKPVSHTGSGSGVGVTPRLDSQDKLTPEGVELCPFSPDSSVSLCFFWHKKHSVFLSK